MGLGGAVRPGTGLRLLAVGALALSTHSSALHQHRPDNDEKRADENEGGNNVDAPAPMLRQPARSHRARRRTLESEETFLFRKCGGRSGAYSGAWLGSASLLPLLEIDPVFRGLEAGSHLAHAAVAHRDGAWKFDSIYLSPPTANPTAGHASSSGSSIAHQRGGFSVMHLSAFEHGYIKHQHGYSEKGQANIADIFRRTADKECSLAGVGNATQASATMRAQVGQAGAAAACSALSSPEAPRPSIVAVIPFHAPSCTKKSGQRRGLRIEILSNARHKKKSETQTKDESREATDATGSEEEKCAVGNVPKNQGNAHSVVDAAVKFDYLRSTLCSLKPWVDKAVVVVMRDELDAVRQAVEAWPFAGGDGAQQWLHVAAADEKQHAFCGQPRMLPVCTLQLLKDGIPGVALEPHDVIYYTESDQVARWGTNRAFLCAALKFIAERRSSAYLTPVWVESRAKEDPVEMRGSRPRHCGDTKYSANLSNSSAVIELPR